MRVCFPACDGVCQLNSHNRHEFEFDSPSNFVLFQVPPPSVLSSTFVISASHAHAAPQTRTLVFAGTVSLSAGHAISALICISLSGVSSAPSSRLCQYA